MQNIICSIYMFVCHGRALLWPFFVKLRYCANISDENDAVTPFPDQWRGKCILFVVSASDKLSG